MTRRAVVGLLTGCVQGAFFPGVNSATARVLQAEGCDVVVPASQGCCGALSVHNGREEEAQGYARRLVDTFEAAGVEWVVVNAAGCGSTMKEYAELLADDPAYADAGAGLRRAGARRLGDPRRARPGRPAAPARDDRRLPRRLPPRARPGRPGPAAAAARGDPRPGAAGDRRARAVLRLGRASTTSSTPSRRASSATARPPTSSPPAPQVLVTANPGCLMQVTSAIERSGHPMGMAHTVEVLDASIRGLAAARDLRLTPAPVRPAAPTISGVHVDVPAETSNRSATRSP